MRGVGTLVPLMMLPRGGASVLYGWLLMLVGALGVIVGLARFELWILIAGAALGGVGFLLLRGSISKWYRAYRWWRDER